mmetsp:Transcript_118029/g.205500  ORF Transcript_118029/g.205500 Transcript_118029/m.205500 type:complete len:88 (+) Transcript_118029:1025-1288(+)
MVCIQPRPRQLPLVCPHQINNATVSAFTYAPASPLRLSCGQVLAGDGAEAAPFALLLNATAPTKVPFAERLKAARFCGKMGCPVPGG